MSEQPKVIFGDETISCTFSDLQPVVEFKDESENLVFDISFDAFLLVGINEFLLVGPNNAKLRI